MVYANYYIKNMLSNHQQLRFLIILFFCFIYADTIQSKEKIEENKMTFVEKLKEEKKIDQSQVNYKKNLTDIQAPKNIIFLEFGGVGFAYTLNYYRMLIKQLSLRVGFTITFDAFDYYLPIVFSYIYTINHNHRIEFGLGSTIAFSRNTSKKVIDAYGVFIIGYRFFPFGNGLSINITLTPFFGNTPYTGPIEVFKYFLPWASLGIGYAF